MGDIDGNDDLGFVVHGYLAIVTLQKCLAALNGQDAGIGIREIVLSARVWFLGRGFWRPSTPSTFFPRFLLGLILGLFCRIFGKGFFFQRFHRGADLPQT